MFKKKPEERWALIDASKENLPLSTGVVVSRHASVGSAVLAQILWEEGQTNPRSRIVKLAKPLDTGESVDPLHHLEPMDE
jgi:hypothetical protein